MLHKPIKYKRETKHVHYSTLNQKNIQSRAILWDIYILCRNVEFTIYVDLHRKIITTDVYKKIRYTDWDCHYFPWSFKNNSGIALQNCIINRVFLTYKATAFCFIMCHIQPNVVVKWLTLTVNKFIQQILAFSLQNNFVTLDLNFLLLCEVLMAV
jgi:hypothetical protein